MPIKGYYVVSMLAYMYTECDDSSISRSRYVIGVPTFTLCYVTYQRHFQGSFVIHGLGLAVRNLPTKFEMFISTRYEI